MRNPLSAILQCSDEISSTLSEFRSGSDESAIPRKLADLLDSSIDAAQTIALCAQHQVRMRIFLLLGSILIKRLETHCRRYSHFIKA